jgi:ABC-2 type transport system permease protein
MTLGLRHSFYMMGRSLTALLRQPWWIAITLVQPVIWLLLYGALFKRVVEIPGFQSGSYIQFLAPGVVVMTALFSSGWGGMAMIDDIDKGVVDRFLVSPVVRSALITGRVMNNAVSILIQAVIIVALALIVGATFPSGVIGVVVMIVVAMLLGAAFGAISNGLALLTRREETLIAIMNFLLLPLTFLSSAFMQKDLMPGWMQTVADLNPVNWAVEAGRMAILADTDWAGVALRSAGLLVLLVVCSAFATRAFRAYQRSV